MRVGVWVCVCVCGGVCVSLIVDVITELRWVSRSPKLSIAKKKKATECISDRHPIDIRRYFVDGIFKANRYHPLADHFRIAKSWTFWKGDSYRMDILLVPQKYASRMAFANLINKNMYLA